MTHPEPFDVREWHHPEPPDGFADGVLAAIDRDDARRRRRTKLVSSLGAAVLAVAAVAALVPRGVAPVAAPPAGELTADATRQIELAPGALAVVERYAHLVWSAAGVVQDRGDVFYRLAPGVRLEVRTPAGAVSSEGACSRVKIVASSTGPATVLVSVAQGEVEVRGTSDRVVLAAGRYARIDPDRIRTDVDDVDGAIAFALVHDRARTYVEAFRANAVAPPPAPSATLPRPPPARVPSAPTASVSAVPSSVPPKRPLRVPRCECQPSDSLCACFDLARGAPHAPPRAAARDRGLTTFAPRPSHPSTRRIPMKTVHVALAFALTLAPTLAFADPPARGAAPRAGESRDGYSYTFTDDPLDAGGLNASDARIRVRPGGIRGVLTRPRTSFVPEMLRSVEKL